MPAGRAGRALTATAGRELGLWTCTALVVGNTIGMGVFVLPAALAPYGLNALLGWAITVAGMLVIARIFARLARAHPDADSPYVYIEGTLGAPAAFIALWCYWVSIWVANAALALGIAGYVAALLRPTAGFTAPVVAVVLVWACTGVNLLGVRTGGRVQVATTILKLLPMVAVVGLGIWVLHDDPFAYTRDVPSTPISNAAMLAAATIALFAMLGIESAAMPAGRVRDPGRTIPRATFAGAVVTAAVCVLVTLVLMLLIPQAELAVSEAPFADLLERYAAAGSGRWIAFFVVISGLGALNGWTLLLGEITHSMASHGVLPRCLTRLNRRGAPAVALLFVGCLASGMILLNLSRTLVQGFTFLTLVVTAANLPLYLFCALALCSLAWRAEGQRAYGLALMGALGTLYCLFWFVGLGAESSAWALGLAAAGLPVFLVARARRRAGTPSAA
jgi:APA family basic amino acid/polyamine antiporter